MASHNGDGSKHFKDQEDHLHLPDEGHFSFKQLLSITNLHHRFLDEHIDLCPSNAWLSASARLCMGSKLSNSYHTGILGPRLHSGVAYIDLIARDVKSKLKHLFGFPQCCCHFLSGMQALTAAFAVVLKKGDTVFSLPVSVGGHFSHQLVGPLKLFDVSLQSIPVQSKRLCIDYKALNTKLKKYKPKLLILGSNQPLFEYDLSEISKMCKQTKTLILYDMSHVAGLIATGLFQKDLADYVDIVSSSTSKAFQGPNHGFVLYHNEAFKKHFQQSLVPLLTSNTHPQELAALSLVASEWIEFGKAYAKDMIEAALFFAKMLDEIGFDVAFSHEGYTQSHMMILRRPNVEQSLSLLNQAGITASLSYLPEDEHKEHLSGIRFGVHNLVRRGFQKEALTVLAKAIKAILIDLKNPQHVHFETIYDLACHHKSCLYSFDQELYEHRKETILKDSTNQDHVLSMIASIPSLSSLNLKTLMAFKQHFIKSWYEKQTLLFQRGQVSDSIYFVLKGAIDIQLEHKGTVKHIATVGVGGHLGEVGVLGNQERLYRAVSHEKTLCLVLPKEPFVDLLEKHESLLLYFAQYVVDLAENTS